MFCHTRNFFLAFFCNITVTHVQSLKKLHFIIIKKKKDKYIKKLHQQHLYVNIYYTEQQKISKHIAKKARNLC